MRTVLNGGFWALCFVLLVLLTSSSEGQTFSVLHNFGGGAGEGGYPLAGLTSAGGTLYGTTPITVYAIRPDSTGYRVIYTFNDLFNSCATLVSSGATLYGTRTFGPLSGETGGIAFALGTNGNGFTILHDFGDSGYSPGAASPYASLVLAGSTLYGTACVGGPMVFAVNTDGTGYTAFNNVSFNDYSSPEAALILCGATLYGTTTIASVQAGGTVFALNTNGTGFTVLHEFVTGAIDGYDPVGGLAVSGTTLYGTTATGYYVGLGYGTIFSVNTDGTGYRILHNFDGSDGSDPAAGLVLSGTTLFGTTTGGGNQGFGTIFAVNTDGTGYRILHNFNGTDGAEPVAGVVLSGGTLYGTASRGGSSGFGTVFSLTVTPPAVGSLQVTLSPAAAVNGGAQWQVDGGVCQTNGATVCGLAVGSHTVGFSAVAGWITPASQTVTVNSNQTTVATGIYAVAPTPPALSGCAIFTRPTDTILINGHTLLTNQMTIEAEILIPSSFPVPSYGFPRIFEEQLSGAGDKQFWASPSAVGGSTWVADNQNSGGISLASSIGDDIWHHLAFVHDSNEVREYLDGIQIGKVDFSGDPSIANSPNTVMSIGAFLYTDGGAVAQSFIGAIQWVRVSCSVRYSGASVVPPLTVPLSDAFTQLLFDFRHFAAGTSSVYDLSPNHFIGVVAMGFSGATAPSFVPPAPPVFQSVTQTNQSITLSWSSVSGQIYSLQYKTNLAQTTWNNLGFPLVATNGIITVTDTPTPDALRFYQVVQSH